MNAMPAALALSWTGWILVGGWRYRPLRRPWVDPAGNVGPRWVEQLGARVQQRAKVVSELAPLSVGLLTLFAVMMLVVSPALATAIVVGTAIMSRWQSIARRRRLQLRMAEQVPHLLDLLRLCLDAGLSSRSAISRLATLVPDPLGAWCRSVSTRSDRGAPLRDALVAATGKGHPMELVARTLASSETSGVAVGPAVEELSAHARAAIRRHSMERVRRLPVQMLLPLVFCTLPAFIVVAVVPMAVTQLRGLL